MGQRLYADSRYVFFCSPGSYVELSDRLNDKLDEATDLEMDLERARATALRWQEMALHSGTN